MWVKGELGVTGAKLIVLCGEESNAQSWFGERSGKMRTGKSLFVLVVGR